MHRKTYVLTGAAATLTAAMVMQFEGYVPRGYVDPAGIATKCFGDTKDVVIGQSYSAEECLASLQRQLTTHGNGVLACVPQLAGHTPQLAASVSFAYNIGTKAFCHSVTAQRFRAGDFTGACRAISEDEDGRPQWVMAGGRVLPGLVKRRAAERALCEKGL